MKLLRQVRTLQPDELVRGRTRLRRRGGSTAAPTSRPTPPCLRIESWRWAGVPWLVRTGKCLAVTGTEAIVTFNAPPRLLFTAEGAPEPGPNRLRFLLGSTTA
ncbi:MAG: hypothetical protein R2711_11895 [Acidimicrobiales bacterium]